MQKEYEETLEDLIIDVASLCCEEYDLQRRYVERTMERVSPEKEF